MALYTYRALDKQGEIVQDKLEGSGEMAVAHELRQQGLLVIDVKEQSVANKDILAPFKGIRLADLVVFSRQLATMINAGLHRAGALRPLRADRKPQAQGRRRRRAQGRGGWQLLSEGSREAPRGILRLYVEMVKAGRSGESSTASCCAWPTSWRGIRTSGARSGAR